MIIEDEMEKFAFATWTRTQETTREMEGFGKIFFSRQDTVA
jgi:hypothetical protein